MVICAVLRGADCVRTKVAPRARELLAVVVRVSGCSGTGAEIVAGHVALAALGTGALAVASAFAGTGSSQLLKVVGVVVVSALALHAVVVVVRRHHGRARRPAVRPLVTSALARLPAAHARVPAARALALACEPRRLWFELDLRNAALGSLLRAALSQLALPSAASAIPGLGQVLDVIEGGQASLASARFVRELALAANDLGRQHIAA